MYVELNPSKSQEPPGRVHSAHQKRKRALRSEACNALGASDGINHTERCRALAQNRVNHTFIDKSMIPPYTLVIYAHGTWPQKCLSMGPSRHPLSSQGLTDNAGESIGGGQRSLTRAHTLSGHVV